MSWLGVIKAGLLAFIALIGWLKMRKSVDQAIAEILAKQLQGALDEIEQANKARDAVRADIAAGKLRDADKFKRPD